MTTGPGRGGVEGLVGTDETDPEQPGAIGGQGGDPFRRASGQPDVGIEIEGEHGRADLPRLRLSSPRVTLFEVGAVPLEHACVTPGIREVALDVAQATGAGDLEDAIEPECLHARGLIPQVSSLHVGGEMGLADQFRPPSPRTQGSHDGRGVSGKVHVPVGGDAESTGIRPGRPTQSGGNALGRRRVGPGGPTISGECLDVREIDDRCRGVAPVTTQLIEGAEQQVAGFGVGIVRGGGVIHTCPLPYSGDVRTTIRRSTTECVLDIT